jgi:hypothetical protein
LSDRSRSLNQTLAYHSLALLARLFRHGMLSYHGGFINLATGRMAPLPLPIKPEPATLK